MTRRARTALLLSAAAALAVPASAAAIVLPTQPWLADPPRFATGTTFGPGWTPSVFTVDATGTGYTLEVWDLTTGVHELRAVDAPSTSATFSGRQDGHDYRIRIRAREVRCTARAGDVCLAAGAATSPWSDWVETRTDTTGPSGTIAVDGGAQYTRSREVTLDLSASDPGPGGVGGVQISTDGAFSCVSDPGAGECPVPMAAGRPFTLPEGPDGSRTVWVTYRDDARAYFPTGTLISLAGVLGNPSPVSHDTIVLDRSRPTPLVTTDVPAAGAGEPVAFSAASSTDATSGVDPASAIWDFGDGTAPVHGLQAEKRFAAPGTYAGSLTIADRAGNPVTKAFSFTVTGSPAPSGGGSQVTGPGGREPAAGTPPAGTTVPGPSVAGRLRGARRLGRSVQDRVLRIRVRLARRTPVRVTILRVTAAGTAVVRRTARTAGPGPVVFTFTAPKAGRHLVRVTAGSDRLTFPMAIAKR